MNTIINNSLDLQKLIFTLLVIITSMVGLLAQNQKLTLDKSNNIKNEVEIISSNDNQYPLKYK